MNQHRGTAIALFFLVVTGCASLTAHPETATDPLASWNDGPSKQAIVQFVKRVTTQGGADFVPVAERIATFDNDGTLWSEQPLYFQLQFAIDRVKQLAPEHPEWKTEQPFQAVLEGDKQASTNRSRYCFPRFNRETSCCCLIVFVFTASSVVGINDCHTFVCDITCGFWFKLISFLYCSI